MYLYSAALGVVVGLKESRRHGASLESPGIEDLHHPGYILLRILLPRTPVNRERGESSSARVGTFREVPSEAQHSYALFPDIIDS